MDRDHQLLERDSHLEALDAALAEVAAGRGVTLLVEGAAGTGKTSLLQAAATRAREHDVDVLPARGSEIEREFGFGLARQMLEPPLTALAGPERDALLAGPAQPAALAVAPERGLDSAAPPDGFSMLHALFLVTTGLARIRPRLLVVDDAHWGDPSSLRALSYLAGRIGTTPLALVVAFRPGEPGAPEELLEQLRAEPGVQRLSPAPLGPASVARLVRERLPGADDQACRAAAEATAGNPLYLTELLRSLAADAGRNHAAEAIQHAALPSLGTGVARRVAQVAPEAPRLAAAMAVLGDHSALSRSAQLAGVDRETAGQVAQRLRRIEILDSEDPSVFVHPLVRRSVYDGLTTAERDALHGAAADLMESGQSAPEVVAAHRAAIRPSGSSDAARAMVRAAAGALGRGAPEEAVRWYERALEEEAPEPPRAELLAALGTAEVALLDPAALDHLRQALETSDDPALSARVAVTLAPPLFAAGRWTEAADVVAAADAMLGDSDPAASAELAGIALLITGYSLALVDRVPMAPERLEALGAGDGWAVQALAAMRAAYAVHTGQIELGRELVERALAEGTLVAERERGIWATSHLLVAMAELDDNERALAVSTEIEAAAELEGSMNSTISAVSHGAWIRARLGDLPGATEALGPFMQAAVQTGNPTFVAAQLFYLQDALLEMSGTEEHAAIAEELDLEESGLAGTWMGAMVLIVRGRLRAAAMDHAGAVPSLRSAHEIARGLSMGPAVAPTGSLLALSLPPDRRAEADRLVAEELDLARATGLDRPQGLALRAAGLLAGGEEGAAMLRESASLLDACGARVERARSLLALGSVLRRDGGRLEARTELTAAVELARTCGADVLAERAREELWAAGGRPRRDATTGPDALTASELRVARMAAEGATTPEIARALVVSAKTVETHLTHAYAKLGLSGPGARGRLADALNGAGPAD